MKKNSASLFIGIAMSFLVIATFVGLDSWLKKMPKLLLEATKEGMLQRANAGLNLLKRAGGDFFQALSFEPKIVIDGQTVHTAARQITEITTAEKLFSHTYSYEVTWAASKKTLILQGDFRAKAGFVIDEASLFMEIAPDASQVILHHKAPKILSCELIRLRVLKDENGWWNQIQKEDREAAQNGLLRQARELALTADLKVKAVENLLHRLQPLKQKHGLGIESQLIP